MAQSVIGALRVNLGLDSAQFERGAKRVNKPLQDMRKQFMVVAGAAAALGTALSAMALKGAQEIDRAAKSAQRLDASIGAFRALEIAAGDAGVSLSSITNDIQTMNRELARIGEGGNADRALKNLGIAASDIAGVDADEKMSLIADRVQALGLSAGETTAILRDLGVRNREMALLMLGGGDAIRQARADVEDYGLAISEVDASKIEQANDQISRLGIVSQYVGQQLARELVPPLGQLAQAMTDSMREGGALRTVLDALIGNIQRLGTYIATAVTWFGVRYVGALVAARIATLNLSTALLALRGAIIRTGFGLLIVGAGELVYQLTRLVAGAGSFGNAMSLLGDVANAVWAEIGQGGQALGQLMKAVAAQIGAAFIRAFAAIFDAWDSLLNSMYGPFNSLMEAVGIDFRIRAANPISGALEGVASDLEAVGIAAANSAGETFRGMTQTRAAIDALRETLNGAVGDTEGAESALDRLNDEMERLEESGAAGGGGAKAAAEGVKDVEREATRTERALGKVRDRGADVFADLVTRTTTLREAVASLASDLARMFARNAFSRVFGSLFPGVGDFGGFRALGGPVSAGKGYIVGENGPEWFTPGQSGMITPNGGSPLNLRVVPSPLFEVVVDDRAAGVAAPMVGRAAHAQQKSYGRQAQSYQMRGTT